MSVSANPTQEPEAIRSPRADESSAPLISAKGVTRVFGEGAASVRALRGVDLSVGAGEFVALVGPSGSGKTTLLNLLGALDVPTEGELFVLGKDLSTLTRTQRSELRLHQIGFVFQAYNLVPVLTARENVEFVLELQGVSAKRRHERSTEILDELGLSGEADRRPDQLSGGQQQRVAVARAVASQPRLILADEPTANLDGKNAEGLMQLMHRLHESYGMTFLFATHDPRVMRHAKRIVTLEDGAVLRDETKVQGQDHVSELELA
jgi:putative ABC transport system ATP-binding protein